MKQVYIAFTFWISVITAGHAQLNITQLGRWYANGQTVAGCWHYADSAGKEYALIGARDGIMILDVTNPGVPVFLFQLPGLTSLWHEIKVSGNYAYAVSEAVDPDTMKDGLQIINLSYLPDSVPNYFWHTDDSLVEKLRQAHSITVDDQFIYVNGHSVPNQGNGVLILDKTDPWNPKFVGRESNRYCHDSFVRGDTLWTSDIQDGMFSVYDITDRSNPILLATQQTPLEFNHNTWLSDDGNFLYTTDERRGAPIGSYDVSDLNNITLVDAYYTTNLQPGEAHNVRVLNDFIINASYGDTVNSQVTIVDAARPANLIEVGNFQTGGTLCWDADPYLPSGIIIATGTHVDSVYLLQPTYIRACYLEGHVTDSLTGLSLFNVKVDNTLIPLQDSTNLSGDYKTGYHTAGVYNFSFSKPGYFTKDFQVQLNNGVLTTLDVQLVDSSHIGIYEQGREDWIRVENNPGAGEVRLHLSPEFFRTSSTVGLSIIDITGKIIYDRKVSEPIVLIRKKDLAAGTYMYSVINEKGMAVSGKLIFQ